ncbi:MAG TPA: Zn-ribbon domain-containing OB-fold protein [Candidatus Korarchaeota archaeon]|nr:Zn-ribbon domain-containing OB-fold protein [Candidatus Korarchaeota archaeon]
MSEPFITSKTLSLVYKIPISRISKFWDGLKEGKVLATRCKRCSTLRFPPSATCPSCYSSEVEWVELSKEGVVETYTKIVAAPASFSGEAPYIVVVARMKEGVKILAWFEGENISIGMRVRLLAKEEHGSLTYRFVPLVEKGD